MSYSIYLATPIDRVAHAAGYYSSAKALAQACLKHSGIDCVYTPSTAMNVRNGEGLSTFIRDANNAVLEQADLVLAHVPLDARTWGVPAEVERALLMDIPVGLLIESSPVNAYAVSWSQRYSELKAYVDTYDSTTEDYHAALDRLLTAIIWDLGEVGTFQPLPTALWDENAKLPTRAHDDDAGLDLYVSQDVDVAPGQFVNIPCGMGVQLPEGTWGLLTGRSSTMRKRGLQTIQGVIDCGYRGELFAGVFNPGKETVHIERGERLHQLIILPNLTAQFTPVPVSELKEHARGTNGFGSSGK